MSYCVLAGASVFCFIGGFIWGLKASDKVWRKVLSDHFRRSGLNEKAVAREVRALIGLPPLEPPAE